MVGIKHGLVSVRVHRQEGQRHKLQIIWGSLCVCLFLLYEPHELVSMRKNNSKRKESEGHNFKAYWDLRRCYPYVIEVFDGRIRFRNREYDYLVQNTKEDGFYEAKDISRFEKEISLFLEPSGGNQYFFYNDKDAPYKKGSKTDYRVYQQKLHEVRNILRKQGLEMTLNFPFFIKEDYSTGNVNYEETINSKFLIRRLFNKYPYSIHTPKIIKSIYYQLRDILPTSDFEEFVNNNQRLFSGVI